MSMSPAPTDLVEANVTVNEHGRAARLRHVVPQSPTKHEVFRYQDLPQEIKYRILGFTFASDQGGGGTISRNTNTALRAARVGMIDNSNPSRSSVFYLKVRQDFASLFVSRQFLQDALAIYAKKAYVEAHFIYQKPANPSKTIKQIVSMTVKQLMASIPTLKSEEWRLQYISPPLRPVDLSKYMKNLATIDIYAGQRYIWTRAGATPNGEAFLSEREIHGLPLSVHPRLRRVLRYQKVIRYQRQQTGTFTQYILDGQWPSQVFYLVSVLCYVPDVRHSGTTSQLVKRELMLDVKVDARTYTLVAVRVYVGAEVHEPPPPPLLSHTYD
ncbi:hypothetical protein PMZ80_000871 [Knufia obscura]|uniref:Uncharacterized protein n=1 Tax=Knufia obscura TaxID=1635080 RepID=A0ABR0S2K1_9EURO|nr:hypothetical protein PMZ80_000871 [Knufia obscura]